MTSPKKYLEKKYKITLKGGHQKYYLDVWRQKYKKWWGTEHDQNKSRKEIITLQSKSE